MKPEKTFELREIINEQTVIGIGTYIKEVWSSFDEKAFQQNIIPKLPDLALKERANTIAEELYNFLPKDFSIAGQILVDALGPELGAEGGALENNAFFHMAHGVYVSRYGLEEANFELSARFLYEMTKRFTSEFAIRVFLEKYPERMLEKLKIWVKDDNEHVRRLVSEGTRPRLPWAPRVKVFDKNYTVIIALLGQLKNDDSLYVRRSVANHLNDLTKDRKELVLKTLKEWNKKSTRHIIWITKHALRTLVKAGNKDALELLGYGDKPAIEVKNFGLKKDKISLGEKLDFSFHIDSKSKDNQALMVDYIIYFQKANGKQSPKVFKLKMIELDGGASVVIQKKQLFQHLRTRTLYAGKHTIELQINGQILGKKDFDLIF